MYKKNIDLILTSIFFILFNTSSLWEGKLGFFAIVSLGILFLSFLMLLIRVIYLTIRLIIGKTYVAFEVFKVGIITVVLVLAIYQPHGFIDYNLLYGKKVFFAKAEGSANCTTNLSLFENGKFHYQEVCFGVKSVTGKYKISNDSIYFLESLTSDSFFKYGLFDAKPCVSDPSNSRDGSLKLYLNYQDSIPKADICILKNELFIK